MKKNKQKKEKQYLKKITRKQLWILRILIYLFGTFLVLCFLLLNTLRTEIDYFDISEIEKKNDYLAIKHFSDTDYPIISLSLKLKGEVSKSLNNKETDIKVMRTLSPLTRKKGDTITKKEDLKEKLQISENLPYYNGDTFSSLLNFYYIEKGKVQKISNKHFRESFIPTSKKREIGSSIFLNLEQGEHIDSKRIYSDLGFPKNLIIKSGGKFFITGGKTIDPIFSEKLIKKINPDFQYIAGHPPSDKNLKNMHCSKSKESSLDCFIELQKNPGETFSNVYYFEIKNINPEEIEGIALKLKTKDGFKSRLIKVKDLLW